MLRPDPPSSLGNPPPPFAEIVALPDAPPLRTGRVVDLAPGVAGIDLGRCRNILVVKLDFIGDWVLTTPFLAGLRAAAPQAAITAVVLDRVYDLAAPCRLVDRVIAVPAAAEGPVRFGAASAEALAAFLADMRGGGFDLALVPRWDTDFNGATRIAGLSGASRVVGFSESCTERKRIDNAGLDRHLDVALRDLRQCHEVEHALGLLDALGGRRETALRLDLTDEDRAAADAFRAAQFGDRVSPFLALAPFAAGRRQWPLDRSATVASRLARRFGLDVVVVGGPDNAVEARALSGRIRVDGVRTATAAGALRLRESAALIGEAALFLGMDSGPAHIAAAFGVPVAVVSGHPAGASAHHPGAPERFGPWAEPSRVLILRAPAHRPPCADGCEGDEPHCILGIEADHAVRIAAAFAEAVIGDRT